MKRIFTPSGEIVHSKYSGQPPSRWLDPDSESTYRIRPHPRYGADSVFYEFNSHGYRCAEFSARRELNVLSVGCSYTFGLGLPAEETYPALLCQAIEQRLGMSVANWNLGIPGCSNDFMSRALLAGLPALRPDFVLVMFTELSRREFITADMVRVNVFPHMRGRPQRKLDREILKHHRALWTPYQDQENFYKNYKLIELLLDRAEVEWVFTSTDPSEIAPLLPLLDRTRYLGHSLEAIDTARDHLHRGPESQRRFVAHVVDDVTHRLRQAVAKREARPSRVSTLTSPS